jgi:hypothetical protein
MFTIRHKTIHGQEVVFQANTVIACSEWGGDRQPTDGQQKGDIIALEFQNQDFTLASEPILYGNVYVMNEYGKTVADYHLGGWEWADK